MPRRIILLLIPLFITLLSAPLTALAEEISWTSMYRLGDAVNAGLNTGFSVNNEIGKWALGRREHQMWIQEHCGQCADITQHH